MADNYLITGYWGEPHVTAENDRGINAGTFGAGRFVLPVGKQFAAEYIGNNKVRVYDGKLVDNGAAAGIPAGEYVDLTISNAGQSKNRYDLIVFQYSKNSETQVESGEFVVVEGTEVSGTPQDPNLTQADLLSGTATVDQMALWRISVSGASISGLTQVFEIRQLLASTGVISIPMGGTGAQTAAEALSNLGGVAKTKYIGTAGENIDTYTATGIYFFGYNYVPEGAPVSSNGWLIVLNASSEDNPDSYVKQIWLRAGTPGTNDMQMLVRTKGDSASTWGPWFTALTNVLTSDVYGDALPSNPVTGQLFFLPADVADEMGL